MKVLIATACLLVLAMACSNDEQAPSTSSTSGATTERVLRLKTGDFTEREFRATIRIDWNTAMCEQVEGLSLQDLVDISDAAFADSGETPVQEGAPDDRLRAAEIIQEECERLTG